MAFYLRLLSAQEYCTKYIFNLRNYYFLIAKMKSLWRPDGFIVNRSADRNNLPPSAFGKTQVVFIGSSKRAAQRIRSCFVPSRPDAATLRSSRYLREKSIICNPWFSRGNYK